MYTCIYNALCHVGDSVLEKFDIFMLFSILQSKQVKYEMKLCSRVILNTSKNTSK